MLFNFNETQIQIISLENSFTITPTGKLKLCLILHLVDWESYIAYTTKVTIGKMYWDFFLAIINPEESFPVQNDNSTLLPKQQN